MKARNLVLMGQTFVVALALSGCATIFKGSTEEVSFSSDQPDTKVYINGQFMGKAPVEIKLQSKKTYTVEFRKDGYESKTVLLPNSVGAGWIILDVLALGFVPLIVDAATGNWFHLETDQVAAALEKK